MDAVTLPCLSPANFSPDRIRAAFLRCFASLLYNYRKYMEPIPPGERSTDGKLFNFKTAAFIRGAPRDSSHFLEGLVETQAFNEFIFERCSKSPDDPEVILFDQIITAKRNRGRHGLFQKQRCSLPPTRLMDSNSVGIEASRSESGSPECGPTKRNETSCTMATSKTTPCKT